MPSIYFLFSLQNGIASLVFADILSYGFVVY